MFASNEQYRDWLELQHAIDESPEIPLCTNDPDLWFPPKGGKVSPQIKTGCGACPIRIQCAVYGLKWEENGFWGGVSPSERKQLRYRLSA